ncbi:MAG: redoxin domain-containing protein [bacterium]|nr:redoxin domain-containing protein [Planctomycetota bacterium]HIL52468.1 redoxin domain-containing protein [Planctomycetota bacterium]
MLIQSVALVAAFLTTGPMQKAPIAQAGPEAEKPARTWQAKLGQAAPDFELLDSNGKSWQLCAQRGKLVVLEWYNPECPVVRRAHAPEGPLANLGNEATDRGVVWLAINSSAPGAQGASLEANREGIKRMGIRYPLLLDSTGWVGRMYAATNTPQLFIIDAEGLLAYSGGHEDKQPGSPVERALAELADGRSVATPRTKAVGCSVKYSNKAKLGLVAPTFKLNDLKGKPHTLSDLRGSFVVLEWFNPLCPVVKRAHSRGGALEAGAARQQKLGVQWLAINSGAPQRQGTRLADNLEAQERWQLSHPILLDAEGKVGQSYGAKTTPQMVLIDPRGVIVYTGAHQDRAGEVFYIDQALTELRAGQEVSQASTRSFGCSVKYDK